VNKPPSPEVFLSASEVGHFADGERWMFGSNNYTSGSDFFHSQVFFSPDVRAAGGVMPSIRLRNRHSELMGGVKLNILNIMF
jgi:hypothetical protein